MTRLLSVLWMCLALVCATGCSTPEPPIQPLGERWGIPRATPRGAADLDVERLGGSAIGTPPRTEFITNPVREPLASSAPVGAATIGKQVQLDFQDTDIKSVVDAVLGDILKLSYTVAPQVQGKITLRTGRPVEREALLPALEAALTTVSAALVAQEGGYLVLPMDAVPQRVRGAYRGSMGPRAGPGYAVEIVPLRYVGAREMQRILEVFSPKGSVLQADEVHNHVVIVGSGIDRGAMLRTIEGFDTDGMKGMTFAFYKLENVSAEQLVTELKQVFQPPIELIGTRVRLVPVDRIRTLMGISSNRSDLELLESWVRRLDVAQQTGERRLFVYNVQNGSAKDLAITLQMVITGEAMATSRPAQPAQTAQATGARNDTAQSSAGTRADTFPSSSSTTTAGRGNAMRIVANDENNSLVILGTDNEYKLIRDAMAKLDVPPRQVLIEAILAEVALGDDLRYGVQWFFDSASSQATFSSAATGAVSSQFPGFSYIRSSGVDARVVINALQSRTDVKVLSAPRLAVLNNQKASLQVGDEVPIRTQVSQSTAAAGSPIVSTIEMRDTGVMLEVTPRVSENGNVILEVTQEVSDVTSTTTSGIDSPTIQRRRLRSVIATRDGATVALGGLIRESNTRSNSGIPLLKDLPFVGQLFRSDSVLNRRTELIVLLVPRVMRDSDETQAVAEQMLNGLSAAAEVASHAMPLVRKPSN